MRIEKLAEHLHEAGIHVSRRQLIKIAGVGGVTAPWAAGLPGGRPALAQEGEPQQGGVWRMAVAGNPTAYPITAPGALVDILVNKTVYNSLVQYQLEGDSIEVVSDLAESWEANDALDQYTFTLHSGVTWHDGEPLTAEDVKFTFDAFLNPDVNASGRGTISSIDSVEVVDELTVQFNLLYPFAPLPVMLGYNKPIVPKHLLEGQDLNQPTEFLQNPVGSGPFRFVEFSQGSHLETEANEDYFEGPPLLDGIIFRVIADGNARVAQLLSGDIDFTVIDPPQLKSVEGSENVVVREAPQVNYFFFAVNHTVPRLQDVRVRQALSYAVNKQAIVDQVLEGYGIVASGPHHPLLGEFYNPEVQTYEYDPDQALALLEEAGWAPGDDGVLVNEDGERFTVLFNGPRGYPVLEQVLTYAQQEYQNLGIEVTLELDEWSVHLEKYHALEYDLLMQWWITPPDPDLYDHYHSESSSNWWAYSNPELDELIVEARSEPNHDRRVDLYHQIQELTAEQLPVIYLYYAQEIQALSVRTEGLPEMGYRDALTWSEEIWLEE